MEQGIVMIPMVNPENSTHYAVARIRVGNGYAQVDTRWGGAKKQTADQDMFLLVSGGFRQLRNDRVTLAQNDTLDGVAVMNPNGTCVCYGHARGKEIDCRNSLIKLRMFYAAPAASEARGSTIVTSSVVAPASNTQTATQETKSYADIETKTDSEQVFASQVVYPVSQDYFEHYETSYEEDEGAEQVFASQVIYPVSQEHIEYYETSYEEDEDVEQVFASQVVYPVSQEHVEHYETSYEEDEGAEPVFASQVVYPVSQEHLEHYETSYEEDEDVEQVFASQVVYPVSQEHLEHYETSYEEDEDVEQVFASQVIYPVSQDYIETFNEEYGEYTREPQQHTSWDDVSGREPAYEARMAEDSLSLEDSNIKTRQEQPAPKPPRPEPPKPEPPKPKPPKPEPPKPRPPVDPCETPPCKPLPPCEVSPPHCPETCAPSSCMEEKDNPYAYSCDFDERDEFYSFGRANDTPESSAQIENSHALKQILQRAKEIFPDSELDEMGFDFAQTDELESSSDPQEEFFVQPDFKRTQNSSTIKQRPPLGGKVILPKRADNPFPQQFPGSQWVHVQRLQGDAGYLEGRMRRGDELLCITAVPGEYQPVPPRHLQGFSRYIQSKSGGYWVRIVKE
ncbi:hypothetical protein LJC42_02120 [Eubacteriales bacterium OttesenSCG-928-K08]|nr:hypothetical protein [Eubacteriales bacterium OttesenSCG-928-K08]